MRALLVLAALLLFPPAARALPPDSPVLPLTPADQAVAATSSEGFVVKYGCQVYGIYQSGDFTLYGGAKDYGVSLASAPGVDGSGRLAQPAALVRGPDNGESVCTALLGTGGASPRLQEIPGTYYWQVWRLCTGCQAGYEVGPVRTLVVRSPIKPMLTLPGTAYVGYAFSATVAVPGAPDGTTITFERRTTEGGWTSAASATVVAGRAEALVTLRRGRQALRVSLLLGDQTIVSEPSAVAVTAAKRWTTEHADGTYKGRRGVAFKVAKHGRQLRDFRASVAMTCPAEPPRTGTVRFKRVKIAPDGSFVAANGAMRAQGTIVGRKVAGRVEQADAACAGSQAFSARRR